MTRDLISFRSDRVNFQARDGTELTGTKYTPRDSIEDRVLVVSAMATPMSFYSSIAGWLAGRGHEVLTFDYRGIGKSKSDQVDFSAIDVVDWARKDIPGAVDYINRDNEGKLHVIAHSLGGQIIGLNGNNLDIDAMASFSAQSGYWKIQHPNQRYNLLLSSYLIFPLLTGLYGKLPWKKLFGGEDIPPEAARQWYRWCRNPGYMMGDESIEDLDNYQKFDTPILAYSFEDDEWGYRESVDRMMEEYSNAPVERIHIDPDYTEFEKIGHFGFFDPDKRPLWEDLMESLERISNTDD